VSYAEVLSILQVLRPNQSFLKFPLIPSGFDAYIIILQGFQRLLIRMHRTFIRLLSVLQDRLFKH